MNRLRWVRYILRREQSEIVRLVMGMYVELIRGIEDRKKRERRRPKLRGWM